MNLICYAVCTMVIRVVEFSSGSTKLERFLLRINILKGNYLILRIGLVGTSVFKNQSLMKYS